VFPVWLSPIQAVVIPISDKHVEYAGEVKKRLSESDLRVEVDDSVNTMQKKIRENARQKVPYLLIVGDREAEEGSVNVRKRGEGKRQEAMKIEEFVRRVSLEMEAKK
jgi:threonyl-tRNA synthetase